MQQDEGRQQDQTRRQCNETSGGDVKRTGKVTWTGNAAGTMEVMPQGEARQCIKGWQLC